MSTFDNLIQDLTRDVCRVQPKDALQFCANWFQSRLEEQRTRTRDALHQRGLSTVHELPSEFYLDSPVNVGPRNSTPTPISPFSQVPQRRASSLHSGFSHSPFGTLNVPGNALLSLDTNGAPNGMLAPTFTLDGRELPPTSPLTADPNAFARYDVSSTPTMSNSLSLGLGDYLHAPSSTILARRVSVSAEPIAVDSGHDDPLPVYPKTADQLRRIKSSIADNFIFRDLDEEQETGVLNAMQESHVPTDHVIIRQGDVGEYFYVVESGLFYCYIHPGPLPPTWLADTANHSSQPEKFLQPGYHPVFGRRVSECKPGTSFGELALMYGHPRAATVQAIEPSTVWALDRTTFRTIILKAAHRRRTMYEHFLSSVPLLSSLEPGERSKIADALVSKVHPDGEAVLRQGEMGDTFFFVEEGEAIVTKTQQGEEGEYREITVGRLKKGDYFGELSLLRLEPRAATVSAVHRADPSQSKLKVAALDTDAFTRLLGPLREIMERKAGESYGLSSRLNH
ncbi:cyclic nucleotide-binding-like protein [Suillus clintonianus]|uniref:cyclic nucleotide-binding-like protein n=1 Tax=Suillus clintonianus TaxID=1904413 RepID=UPI001B86BC72|nr:cyclic nucleotide-binding-like protein [Suillus clintonianus]KAG2146679.1 cyclic nucleotide-binding-like protein [Suillus clintonianus]